jgi:VWFA-related protein
MVRGICLLSVLILLSTVSPAEAQTEQEPAAPQTAEPEPPATAAEQEAPATTFFETVEIEVATIEVFVSDRKGTPVTGLDRDDFELLIDGKPVEITNFYAETLGRPATAEWLAETSAPSEIDEIESGRRPPPQRLRIVVFIDHTNLRAGNRKRALDLLREFLGRNAGPDAGVAVVSLTDRLWIHSDFLNDKHTIARIFDDVERIAYRDPTGRDERQRLLNQMSRGHTGGIASPNRVPNPLDPDTSAPTTAELWGTSIEASIRAYAANEYQQTRVSLEALKRFVGSLGGVSGRKALIYVSDGIVNRPGEDLYVAYRNAYTGSTRTPGMVQTDPNSDYLRQVGQYDLSLEIQKVAEAANAAGVTVYAIDAEGDHATEVRSAMLDGGSATSEAVSAIEANAREPLEYATEATGGRRIQASEKLLSDLALVSADFDSYYSLGFRPPQAAPGANQAVQVRLRGAEAGGGRVVRYRESRRTKDAEQRTSEAMLAAIYYNATANPLELGLTQGEPVRRADGSLVVPVTIEIPVGKLALIPEDAVSSARLSIYITVKNEKGDAGRIQEMPFHLRIPADKVEEAKQHAAHHTLPVVLRPGDQQVAVGVRDEIASTLSTVRLEVAGTI